MREKSGWDFLEFGSREQGSPGELGAPRSSWSQIELEIFRTSRQNQEILRNIKNYLLRNIKNIKKYKERSRDIKKY